MKAESIVYRCGRHVVRPDRGLDDRDAAGARPRPFARRRPPRRRPRRRPACRRPPPGLWSTRPRRPRCGASPRRIPANVQSRVQLGNMYFDAERYQDAISWYDEALKLNPKDVNVSTDLGVCYYYTNQPDRAIRQIEESLRIDPRHTKTLLNLGIVKAFGKQDISPARPPRGKRSSRSHPNSPEAQAAQRALENLQAAHPGGRRCRRPARRRQPRPRSPAVRASNGPEPGACWRDSSLGAAAVSSSGGPCGACSAASSRAPSAPPRPASGRPAREGRADGARPGVRHVRAAVAVRLDARPQRHAPLLFRHVPPGLSGAVTPCPAGSSRHAADSCVGDGAPRAAVRRQMSTTARRPSRRTSSGRALPTSRR